MSYVKVLGAVVGIGVCVCSLWAQSPGSTLVIETNRALSLSRGIFAEPPGPLTLETSGPDWQQSPPGRSTDPVAAEPVNPTSGFLLGSLSSNPGENWTPFLEELNADTEKAPKDNGLRITAIPEPSVIWLFCLGGGLFVIGLRRRAGSLG